jgi:hypothetical protein
LDPEGWAAVASHLELEAFLGLVALASAEEERPLVGQQPEEQPLVERRAAERALEVAAAAPFRMTPRCNLATCAR